jgi:hypothetical protein
MRYLLILLFIVPIQCAAQEEALSNTFKFKEGIYTCFGELLCNSPRYLKCRLDITRPPAGNWSYYYDDSLGLRHIYHDSCFCVVSGGILFVRDDNAFFKSDQLGPVTILHASNWRSFYQKDYVVYDEVIKMLDFRTGMLIPLNKKDVTRILERDADLATELKKNGIQKNPLLLVSYLLKYNERNPFTLPDCKEKNDKP